MINLIMGAMRSGKTTEIFKNVSDASKVYTCGPGEKWEDVLEFLETTGNYIDEAQFLEWTSDKAESVAEFYKNNTIEDLTLYGLDKWHDTTETSLSKYMKYHADSVRYLRARCDGCGEPATLTAKISGDRSEQINEDKALYSPRCEACYDKQCKKQAEIEERSACNGWGY